MGDPCAIMSLALDMQYRFSNYDMSRNNGLITAETLTLFSEYRMKKKDVLMEALKECRNTLLSEESMHAFVIPVEESF